MQWATAVPRGLDSSLARLLLSQLGGTIWPAGYQGPLTQRGAAPGYIGV